MKVRKEKYRRKNNPAVELMRRVIQDKERNDWPAHNAYTSAINTPSWWPLSTT